MLITSAFASAIFKFLKSFAFDYTSFIVLEMIDAGLNSAIYPSALVLSLEWAKTEDRELVSALVLSMYPIGQVINGLIASYTHNYHVMLRIVSLFGFALIFYIWMLPESLRWLLVNRKYNKAIGVVNRAAKCNGVNVSQKTLDLIAEKCRNDSEENQKNVKSSADSFIDILKNRSLAVRFLICVICWISCTFITYGISIASVLLQGDKYVNFMVVAVAAEPAVFLTFLMLRYMQRRPGSCVSFIVTGLSIIASQFLTSNASISLVFFFLGKCFIHHTFTSLYVYTNEMWPTTIRHSVLGICSMLARIGSITAPMTPLLVSNNL